MEHGVTGVTPGVLPSLLKPTAPVLKAQVVGATKEGEEEVVSHLSRVTVSCDDCTVFDMVNDAGTDEVGGSFHASMRCPRRSCPLLESLGPELMKPKEKEKDVL